MTHVCCHHTMMIAMQKSTEIEQLSDRLVELQSELDTVNASMKNQDSSEATMELEAELKVCTTYSAGLCNQL